MAVFEDNFDALNPNWIATGTHPNFTVKAENGQLKLLFGLMPPEYARFAQWAGVYYAEPFDVRNTKITVKVDGYPKAPRVDYPLIQYRAGFMLANKKLPVGVGLLEDPDLAAVYFVIQNIGSYPICSIALLIKGLSSYGAWSFLNSFPPLELSSEITGNTIKLFESDVKVTEFILPFDPSKAYVYLLAPMAQQSDTQLFPSQVDFDYIRIEKLPPPPITVSLGQTTAIMFATMLMMMNASLILRGLRLIK